MTGFQVQGIALDVCKGGCGGIWFDGHELKKVDEPHEAMGEALLHVERNPQAVVRPNAQRECPRCAGMPMMQHFASVKREVTVDECPNCGGFFLDHGELNRVRSEYASEEERRRAAEAVFAELFDEGLDAAAQQSQARLERVRQLARMFRFLLPSAYIPGKQKWGAF
jgi:Zn-finger nucleic acid-binding protein